MKYFQLTKNEQYGIFGLLIILGCLLCVKYYSLQLNFSVEKASIEAPVEKGLKTFQKKGGDSFLPRIEKRELPAPDTKSLVVNSKFDPNHFEVRDWLMIGLPSSIAERTFKFADF